jgi:hypothetical protein
MFVDDNADALQAYWAGDRASELVLSYYRREGLERDLHRALNSATRPAGGLLIGGGLAQ